MFQADMPATIVINEAVGIAQDFGTDESYRFINGVLDSIRKTLEARLLEAHLLEAHLLEKPPLEKPPLNSVLAHNL
jgi:hypothetical protein